jgi:hypothetical protein
MEGAMASREQGSWWLSAALVALAVMPAAGAAAGSPRDTSRRPATTPFRGALDPSTRFLVGRALDGASGRLAEPACQAVFGDFSDDSGRPLERVLAESGYSGQAYLRLVFFADGAAHPHCQSGIVGAFTVPGSRVVHVCPANVRRLSKLDPALVDVLLIHELLHTLGLHENPPTPEEIDARVESRCLASRLAGNAGR